MLKIYTSRVQFYRGPGKIDITVKSGVETEDGFKLFAPTWGMVMGHKNKTISDAKYTEKYEAMMRTSYINNKAYWDGLIRESTTIVLCCYCRFGDFCHRHILAKIMLKIAEKLGVEASYEGEI